MTAKVYIEGNVFYIIDQADQRQFEGNPADVMIVRPKTTSTVFSFKNVNAWKDAQTLSIGDIQMKDGTEYTLDQFVKFTKNIRVKTDTNDDNISTPIIIAKVSKEEAQTTLAVAVVGDLSTVFVKTLEVVDATGFADDKYLTVFSVVDNRFYTAYIKSIAVNVITVRTPLDFNFPIGSIVTSGETNIKSDGSVTPVVYGLRNTDQAIGTIAKITRMVMLMETSTAVDLSKFGDIVGGLADGLVLRKKDGTVRNIFTVRTNGEIAGTAFDWEPLDAQNLQQGQHGFIARLSFDGNSKMGSPIELAPGEDVQIINQDNLAGGTILKYEITMEGNFKYPPV